MSTALLLGFPPNHVVAAKAVAAKTPERFDKWSIKYAPASGRSSGATVRDLEKIAGFADQHADLHIIGFSEDSNRREIAERITPYFRFRWFKYELLRLLRSHDPTRYLEELEMILSEELEWTARVKPFAINSPLLLPQCAFKCERRHSDMWRHALAYGDIQNITGAERAIQDFRDTHHRKVAFQNYSQQKWVDAASRIFDDDGAKHGVAPYPRNWKFSYKLEPGFHYDVTHERGLRFSVDDFERRSHHVKPGDHLNIDPHGHVRG
jgi:hypothetical protein